MLQQINVKLDILQMKICYSVDRSIPQENINM